VHEEEGCAALLSRTMDEGAQRHVIGDTDTALLDGQHGGGTGHRLRERWHHDVLHDDGRAEWVPSEPPWG
jgi:hypothetical protein